MTFSILNPAGSFNFCVQSEAVAEFMNNRLKKSDFMKSLIDLVEALKRIVKNLDF